MKKEFSKKKKDRPDLFYWMLLDKVQKSEVLLDVVKIQVVNEVLRIARDENYRRKISTKLLYASNNMTLARAFIWDRTDSGYTFWGKVNEIIG